MTEATREDTTEGTPRRRVQETIERGDEMVLRGGATLVVLVIVAGLASLVSIDRVGGGRRLRYAGVSVDSLSVVCQQR